MRRRLRIVKRFFLDFSAVLGLKAFKLCRTKTLMRSHWARWAARKEGRPELRSLHPSNEVQVRARQPSPAGRKKRGKSNSLIERSGRPTGDKNRPALQQIELEAPWNERRNQTHAGLRIEYVLRRYDVSMLFHIDLRHLTAGKGNAILALSLDRIDNTGRRASTLPFGVFVSEPVCKLRKIGVY